MVVRYLLVFSLLASAFCGCGQEPAGTAGDGARWFVLYRCSGCHGENGAGGKGPALRPMQLSYGKFRDKIRSSGSSIMPSYTKEQVSGRDITDMYAYLKD